ncbi:methyltransferase [Streptomyces eurythermus]|uniref:methyltransferase n=1 Tax=Streptomyces eurythermus TaxID=42237 RepID=UPI0036AA40EB
MSNPQPPGFKDLGTIIRLMNGAWVQQALYVAAKLGIADLLADGPLPVEELAAKADAHPEALYRNLRALVSMDVFDEPSPRTFALNAAARYLCSDSAHGHRWIVIQHGEEAYKAFAESLYTARTGKPAFDRVFGKPIFEWLAENPDSRTGFNRAMAESVAVPLVAEKLDVTDARTIIDVAGGQGRLLSTLLTRAPAASGVLYDLPEAVKDAPPVLAEYGVTGRVEVTGGSMFEEVPSGGDLYTLCRCLHDFDDAQVATVLANVRAAVRPGGRVAILDGLLPETPGYNPAKIADLIMMTMHGGRFYSLSEFTHLLARAGFEVTDVEHPPPGSDPRAESLVVAVAR